jgi:hypothetical protein
MPSSFGPMFIQPAAGIAQSNGALAVTSNIVAQVVATSGNISLGAAPFGGVLVAPAGAVTAVTMDVGLAEGQLVFVENNSANTITFDVVANSHVANGATNVIAANACKCYIWSAAAARWFSVGL